MSRSHGYGFPKEHLVQQENKTHSPPIPVPQTPGHSDRPSLWSSASFLMYHPRLFSYHHLTMKFTLSFLAAEEKRETGCVRSSLAGGKKAQEFFQGGGPFLFLVLNSIRK